MSWCDLLFAHWRLPPEALARHIPEGLELQTFDGDAWLGLVPFYMDNTGARGLPYAPGVKRFPEFNIRTYVERDGRPGVWFLSLDAANRLAVWGARTFFHLPYVHARMSTAREGEWVTYDSERTDGRLGPGRFVGRYRAVGPEYRCEEGSLDEWLTERYCLYSANTRGRLFRGEIQHAQWPLRRAEAEIQVNTMADAHGVELSGAPDALHFVDRIDVVGWSLERC